MIDTKIIPTDLRVARRNLEGIPNVRILNDLVWNEKVSLWVLHCELTISEYIENPFLPQVTNWYVLVSPEYPLGSISFYPSKTDGISHTFQHQLNNSKANNDLPWRWGSICLDLNVKVLGRFFAESEPLSIEERLAWYFHRALKWLQAASSGDFVKPSETFELPDFSPNKVYKLAFSENAVSYAFWNKSKDNVGIVNLVKINNTNIIAATSFCSRLGKQILAPRWGKIVEIAENEQYKGLWIRLNNLPILEPWQPPSTFGELIKVFLEQGLDFYEMIKSETSKFRDGTKHFLLLGFPIPAKHGEPPIRIHWQALLLPVLSSGSRTMKGFRPNESGKFLFDKLKVINHNVELDWVSSENWNAEQISARGRFPVSFSSQRVLIIGCGAVGSVVAELLVRGNINRVVLIDGEELEVGNLVRHTLGLEDIKKPKAQQLAKRLNSINPNAKVMYIADVFPPRSDNDTTTLKQCDVIIDCTGDDKALISLGQFPWEKEKLIISINLNYGATKSFIFTYKGNRFPVQEYSQRIKPHLTNMDDVDELPIDGIGCWHPVFPARADDVLLLVSACVKEMLDSLEHPISPETCRFAVFEQVLENDTFVGIRKIE